jgi:hypothetical protein
LDKELVWIRRRLHKARKDRDIARRMFLYAAWLIDRYGLPVWPILVTSYARPQQAEVNRYEITLRGWSILLFNYEVVQLNRLDWRDYLKRPNPAAAALMARMNIAPADRVRVKAEILRLLLTLRLQAEKAQLILGFVETYLELTAQEELKLRRQVDTLASKDREQIMRMLLPGERLGLSKGRQEGRLETLREGVLDILEARFQSVPCGLREKLQEIRAESRLRRLHREAVLVENLDAFGAKL